jgi:WS/DGAT/MGAT family acyltransferase
MPDTQAHMRNTDAFTWYMERDPGLRSTIVTMITLDRPPDPARLMLRTERLTRELPMFRQRVFEPPWRLATPRWAIDDDFDLTWHIRWESLPSWDEVLELARRDAMTGFDRAHPLWKATVVTGLPDGGAAVVMKLHHSLTDGVGGMEMGLLLFDQERDVVEQTTMPDRPDGERLGTFDLVRDALADDVRQTLRTAGSALTGALPAAWRVMRSPQRAAADLVGLVGSVARTVRPITRADSPVMTDRHLGRHLATIDVPLDGLRQAGTAAGCTLNDAFLAAVTGGLRRYHERHAAPVDNLRVTMPINVRGADDPIGGNRITLQRFEVPAGETDVVARMKAVHQACRRARDEPAVPHTDTIAGSLNLLPPSVIGSMLKHVDFLASNVPGFPFTVYLSGAEVLSQHAFGPTIGAAVNVTLLSYRDTCFLGVTVDTAAAPDAEVLVACLREGFDEVVAPRRRARGGTRSASVASTHGPARRRR